MGGEGDGCSKILAVGQGCTLLAKDVVVQLGVGRLGHPRRVVEAAAGEGVDQDRLDPLAQRRRQLVPR